MSKIWEREAESDEVYNAVADYKGAMYQLVTQQALYEADQNQSRAYHVICRHRPAFESVASDMGLVLHVEEAFRYVCVRPEEGLRHTTLTKAETLFLIVLARIYDDRAINGEREDDGAVLASIEDFRSAYRGALGCDYPGRASELKDLTKSAKRFGIARLREDSDDPDQPFAIQIMPAISHLIGVTVAGRLGADYQRAENGDANEDVAATEGAATS